MPRHLFGSRAYALFALGMVAFTLYGSYVPFRYRARPWPEVVDSFQWAMENRLALESRSDWVSNCMLGIPLGFCLLGALRVDRTSRSITALVGLAILPLCVAFAAVVEFGQLYFPGRTCAGSDVWAQGIGAIIGIFGWILWGQWGTDKIRGAFGQPGQQGNTAVLLLGYGFFVMIVQLLPLDLTISPSTLVHKARDSSEVTIIPLGEFDWEPGKPVLDKGKKVQDWLELVALCWPLGALLTGLPGKWRSLNGLPRVFGTALLFSGFLELGQLTVSRHPSITDVIVLTFGILLGWAMALALADRGVRKYRLEVALILGQLWFVALALIHWHPFDFVPELLGDRLHDLDWMPMAGQASKNYLWALNEVLTKFTLFFPIGALSVWSRKSSALRPSLLVPVLLSGVAAAILEFGQAIIPNRIASPTDVLFGFVGGWIGAEVTRRLVGSSRRELSLPAQPGRAKVRAAPLQPRGQ
jgi:VanZ family protein